MRKFNYINLGNVVIVVLLDEASGFVGILGDRLVTPPLLHVAETVETPSTVVEAVGQLVTQNRPYSSIIQRPELIEK